MGDDESKRSRLKSKWNRILKPRHDSSANEATDSPEEATNPDALPEFALSSDVTDFLKPSTEKARPKLDIALATRWPSSHEVRSASGRNVNGWSKPRRREGLTVGFARTHPEIIGHGGDTTLDPTGEIGRMKSRRQRSVSDLPPTVPGHHTQQSRQAPAADGGPVEQRPPPPLRAQTSIGEVSAPLDRLHLTTEPALLSPERAQSSPHGRTPTSPLSASKYDAMRASEGMALRRASILPEHSDDDHSSSHSADVPSSTQQATESPEIRLHHEAESPFSPDGPSPFADPKYIRRRSQDVSSARQSSTDLPAKPISHPAGLIPAATASPTKATPAALLASQQQKQYLPYKPATPPTLARNPPSDQHLNANERPRPSSSQSSHSITRRPIATPVKSASNPIPTSALEDFAHRISHTSSVFRLTAQKARPSPNIPPKTYLRTALWWYITGKLRLETLLSQRPQSPQHLVQGHVDLAKAWWILTDPLAVYAHPPATTPAAHTGNDTQTAMELHRGCEMLRAYFTSLTASLARAQMLPPTDSLIQGQDTTIWLPSAALDPPAIESLGLLNGLSPLEALPLGDTAETKFLARFLGQIAIYRMETVGRTEKESCIISLLRDNITGQRHVMVAGQSEDVSLRFGQDRAGKGMPWEQVKWRLDLGAFGFRSQDDWFVDVTLGRQDYESLYAGVHGSRGAADSNSRQRRE